ncbi:phospholipid scramblase 1-like [Puntigrus tetrazona]|uniref:phospholipid scramblase 1-like n=1 Tax=Puntigrus tetrazona TaxID=1606681 RepID=UPI001C890D28|nr:phospholipid scramblase 1-like [Puntigrus tetrazona]XP_043093384.1 phospholipid scramblase 1-like [Puntigrus tetrazona]
MDQLFICKEETTDECLAEVCCGVKPVDRYIVKDRHGHKVFSVLEDSDCCDRQFRGGARPFIMKVTNVSNQELLRLVHPSVHCCGSHELEVQSPPGSPIGYVRHNCHVFMPKKFTLENERGQPQFRIEGPCVNCDCCEEDNFELMTLNEENEATSHRSVGNIIKSFLDSGPNKGQHFVLSFPSNLDVKMKVTVLGACILIVSKYNDRKSRIPLWLTCLSMACTCWKIY